jgi:hypothetical protein
MSISIFERVKNALDTLSPAVPHALAPYKASGNLPDLFIVYQLITSPAEQSADNNETARSYLVQVTIWSRSGLASLPDVTTAMRAAGFQAGAFRQLPQDPETGHYGLAKEFVYLEGV